MKEKCRENKVSEKEKQVRRNVLTFTKKRNDSTTMKRTKMTK